MSKIIQIIQRIGNTAVGCAKAFYRFMGDDTSPLPRLIKRILAIMFTVLALFCLIYWLICGICAGFGISALWIWPLAAVMFGLLALWVINARLFARLRRHTPVRIVVALLLAALFVYFAVIECLIIADMSNSGDTPLDYVIILGAKVNVDIPSLALRCRIDRAYEYLSKNPDTTAVASGGKGDGEDISEAECMRRELTALGIAPERILIEDRSTSTFENLRFSFELIPDNADVGLITNNFHIHRAVRLADAAGYNVTGIPAPYSNPLLIHYMVREFFSITLYRLTGKM